MNIISLLLIIILFMLLFKLNKSMKRELFSSKYNINFLNKKECYTLFNNFKGIEFYKPHEIKFRSNNKANNKIKMRSLYQKNSMKFTKEEELKLGKDVERIFNEFNSNYPLIKEWNFVKMSSTFDFGLPYTVNNTIILPSKFIHLPNLYETLFHEQFHILQYKNPEKFEKFYTTKWNFEKVELPKNAWIDSHFVTNPDGFRNFYTFKLKKYNMLPLVLLFNGNMIGTGIFLTKNNKLIKKDGKPYCKKLQNIPKYFNKFYKIKQNYHPHEIFANLMVKSATSNIKLGDEIYEFIKSF